MDKTGDGRLHVFLEQAIRTMREPGADMNVKYKETARGSLAPNVIAPNHVALNIVEC